MPAALVERFPELGDARIRRGGVLPRIGGWCLGCSTVAGITLGRTVWLGNGIQPSAELLLHEVRHVHQFQAVRAFPLRYVFESLRRGYHHNCFEVDARRFARERLLSHSETLPSEGA
ncbi:MAG: hypothetical protein ABIT38_17760 [Gemmatimonadaceae bacterium]